MLVSIACALFIFLRAPTDLSSVITDVRGVSGGERKRVSIAEVLTNRATVQAWDNATRGLDANTALEYAKIMRILTDVKRNSTMVSLYQAGNAIYDVRRVAVLVILFH